MKTILGRKQRIDNDKWVETMQRIEELVSRAELDQAVATAVETIRKNTRGKRAAYCWSGGKDSLVLSKICEEAGITECMFCLLYTSDAADE